MRVEIQQDLEVCKPLCGSGDFEACVDAWLAALRAKERSG